MSNAMRRVSVLLLLFAASAAQAGWQGKGEAGILFARGNAETDTVNLKLGLNTTVDRWKHELGLAALRASNDGTRTADRYLATCQSDYNYSSRAFWFGGLRYENDKFTGEDEHGARPGGRPGCAPQHQAAGAPEEDRCTDDVNLVYSF